MQRPQDLPIDNHFPSNRLAILTPEFRFLYSRMRISAAFASGAVKAARLAISQKPLYDQAAALIPVVPWWVIACLHHMECDSNPAGGISNGQPWNKVTTIVPKGRGPFKSFANEASFSLARYQTAQEWGVNLAAHDFKDPGFAFWFFNSWNGFHQSLPDGARTIPKFSNAYIYSGAELLDSTKLFVSGKDTSDYNFDPHATSDQVGCMAFMNALENSFGNVLTKY